MKNIKKKISDLKNVVDIQGQDGNWNYDNYMTGLYNGLEMALSIFEEREPIFRTCSKRKGVFKKLSDFAKYYFSKKEQEK